MKVGTELLVKELPGRSRMVWSNGPFYMAMYAQAYRVDLQPFGGLLIDNTGERLRLWGVLDHWLREDAPARLVYEGVV